MSYPCNQLHCYIFFPDTNDSPQMMMTMKWKVIAVLFQPRRRPKRPTVFTARVLCLRIRILDLAILLFFGMNLTKIRRQSGDLTAKPYCKDSTSVEKTRMEKHCINRQTYFPDILPPTGIGNYFF